ncbi:hypothetical protein, partial [Modestobacter versicolor]
MRLVERQVARVRRVQPQGHAGRTGPVQDAGTIAVGNLVALSGPISATAREQLLGQQAWFDEVNANGGIA